MESSAVYGPHGDGERESLWRDLEVFDLDHARSWVIGGDFNVKRFASEISTGGRMMRGMNDFNNFIATRGLIDLPMQGTSFTWSKNRDPPILAKLDRFLVSNDWDDSFKDAFQTSLPRVLSDPV